MSLVWQKAWPGVPDELVNISFWNLSWGWGWGPLETDASSIVMNACIKKKLIIYSVPLCPASPAPRAWMRSYSPPPHLTRAIEGILLGHISPN